MGVHAEETRLKSKVTSANGTSQIRAVIKQKRTPVQRWQQTATRCGQPAAGKITETIQIITFHLKDEHNLTCSCPSHSSTNCEGDLTVCTVVGKELLFHSELYYCPVTTVD